MSNKDLPNGFTPIFGEDYHAPHRWTVAGSEAIAIGDMVAINASGYVALGTSSTSTCILGVAASSVAATASAGDTIYVWDHPLQVFEGQTSGSGALANPYSTNSSAACYDIEGTTGIQEINEDSNTYDMIKIVGVGKDPVSGEDSAVGANQRKRFRWNLAKHAFGTTA